MVTLRNWSILLLLALLAEYSFAQASHDSEEDLGAWRIARLLFRDDNAIGDGTMDDAKARRVIGRTTILSKNKGMVNPFNGKHCPSERKVATNNREEFLDLSRVPHHVNLGLPQRVTEFSHGCLIFYLRSDGNLITLADDGYWFELQRISPRPRSGPKKAPEAAGEKSF